MVQKQCVFTISTGRSGTAYLQELFRQNADQAECIHEMGFLRECGRGTPDLSHKVDFNMRGNTDRVRAFWRQKIARIESRPSPIYVETSHLHCKSGLIENLDFFRGDTKVLIVDLRRDTLSTLRSFAARNDFVSNGNALMFYLDPTFLRRITSPSKVFPIVHWMAWYILEMRCRGAYYKRIIEQRENTFYLQCDLESLRDVAMIRHLFAEAGLLIREDEIKVPPAANKSYGQRLGQADAEQFRRIAERVDMVDTDEIAESVYRKGWHF